MGRASRTLRRTLVLLAVFLAGTAYGDLYEYVTRTCREEPTEIPRVSGFVDPPPGWTPKPLGPRRPRVR